MKEKSAETKRSVLSATLELIAEQGFHGTSVAQIAERAGVNVGSMYYHFKNKDEVLNALYLDCKSRLTDCAFRGCSSDTAADDCLKMIIRNIVRFCVDNAAAFSFIEQYESSPYMAAVAVSREYDEVLSPYHNLFRRLIESELVKNLPPEIFQSLLLGVVSSLAKYAIGNKKPISEADLSEAISAIWDMVKK